MTFEDDLLALEARVLEQAGGDFFRAVAELRRMLATESGDVGRHLEELAIPALQEAAVQGALDGWTLGGQRAVTDAGTARRVDPNTLNDADLRLLTPPAHLTDPFTGLDGLLADAKTRSLALLRTGADALTAAAPVFQAATTARARIVTQINVASNAAALEVGDATRSPMVWEAERDGCVFCLALAGEVVERAGDPFPPADLYAPTPSSMTTTTSAPPLHPHCRCRLAVLVSTEYADALKREAQRSILRGHSLASESQAVRVRAAARLLERDPVAPKTVKAYAAAAVKRGRFPIREVPKGDPRLIITRAEPPKPAPAPKPPKPPAPPAPAIPLKPPGRASLRDELATLKKPVDMQAAARARHPDIKWEGFDMRGAKPDFARDVLATISEMLDQFPGVELTRVEAKLLPGRNTVARAKADIEPTYMTKAERDYFHNNRIEVNSRFLKDPSSLAAGVARSNESGHFHDVEAGHEVRHLVAHEFAHVLDYMTQAKLREAYEREIATANPYSKGTQASGDWLAANVSGYGQSSHEEGVAEAIADALLKGDDALPFSRHFFQVAQRIYREEVPGANV